MLSWWEMLDWAAEPWQSLVLVEIPAHVLLALMVVCPLALAGIRLRILLLLAVVGGLLLDLDHVLWAQSLTIKDMTNLGGRPPTHSLSLAVLAGLVVGWRLRPLLGWGLAAAMVAHLLVDAPGQGAGVPFLAPWLARDFSLSGPVAIAGLVALTLASAVWALLADSENKSTRPQRS